MLTARRPSMTVTDRPARRPPPALVSPHVMASIACRLETATSALDLSTPWGDRRAITIEGVAAPAARAD